MSSGQHRDERVSRPTPVDFLAAKTGSPWVLTVLALASLAASVLTLVCWVAGRTYTPQSWLLVWCACFLLLGVAGAWLARNHSRSERGLLIALTLGIAGVAWLATIPLLTTVGVISEPVMIYPVTP